MARDFDTDLFGHPTRPSRQDPADADIIREIYDAMGAGEPMREIMERYFARFGREYGLRSPVAELNFARRIAGGGVARG